MISVTQVYCQTYTLLLSCRQNVKRCAIYLQEFCIFILYKMLHICICQFSEPVTLNRYLTARKNRAFKAEYLALLCPLKSLRQTILQIRSFWPNSVKIEGNPIRARIDTSENFI